MSFPLTHPRSLGLAAIVIFSMVVVPLSAVFDRSAPGPAIVSTVGPGSAAVTGSGSSAANLSPTDSTGRLGPGVTATTIHHGQYALALRVEPNRAQAHNLVSATLTRNGQPVPGAKVTVTYGMPAMAMRNALTNALPQSSPGSFSLREPVLGMPGMWTMRFVVRAPRAGTLTLRTDDTLR